MKRITLTGKQIRELRDKALQEQRKPFAPKTRVVKSKKVYTRRRYTDGHGDGDFDE